jgi:glycosyltransferase involved in cell wall biosynthesis
MFTGLRHDPENFYPALDVVALTSLNEGTPLTLIEAMANARPVIATAVGGVEDLLGNCVAAATMPSKAQDGAAAYQICERGISVKSNDLEGFCQGLKFLLENEGPRHELGERGRAFVEQNYSTERLAADVLALYEGLIGEDAADSAKPGPGVHAALRS